jgi:hypothetical protein
MDDASTDVITAIHGLDESDVAHAIAILEHVSLVSSSFTNDYKIGRYSKVRR